MRYLYTTACILLLSSFSVLAQNASSPVGQESVADTIRIPQMDGTVITILGVGTVPLAYCETIDGYTIVMNKESVYEYAKQSRNGDLEPSGIKANNPSYRDKKEIRYVLKLKPHLRYVGAKLEEIMSKHQKLNITPKKSKQ